MLENIKQRFQAEAHVEAKWEDLDFDDSFDSKEKNFSKKYWTPELFVENSVGNLHQTIEYSIEIEENKRYVVEKRNIKGTFYESLE